MSCSSRHDHTLLLLVDVVLSEFSRTWSWVGFAELTVMPSPTSQVFFFKSGVTPRSFLKRGPPHGVSPREVVLFKVGGSPPELHSVFSLVVSSAFKVSQGRNPVSFAGYQRRIRNSGFVEWLSFGWFFDSISHVLQNVGGGWVVISPLITSWVHVNDTLGSHLRTRRRLEVILDHQPDGKHRDEECVPLVYVCHHTHT